LQWGTWMTLCGDMRRIRCNTIDKDIGTGLSQDFAVRSDLFLY
jgi:hypothetical protein